MSDLSKNDTFVDISKKYFLRICFDFPQNQIPKNPQENLSRTFFWKVIASMYKLLFLSDF